MVQRLLHRIVATLLGRILEQLRRPVPKTWSGGKPEEDVGEGANLERLDGLVLPRQQRQRKHHITRLQHTKRKGGGGKVDQDTVPVRHRDDDVVLVVSNLRHEAPQQETRVVCGDELKALPVEEGVVAALVEDEVEVVLYGLS